MKNRNILRRMVRFFGALFAIAVLLFALPVLFIQTPAGKGALASWLSRHATVRVGRIEGTLPHRFRIERIELLDDEGTWMTFGDVTVNASLRDAWRRRIVVREVRCSTLEIVRMPVGQRDTSGKPQISFALPRWMPLVVVDQCTVAEGRLAGTVLGEQADFTAHGRMTASRADGVTIELQVQKTNAVMASLALRSVLRTPSRLALDARLDEAAGGPVARRLGFDAAGALTFRLNGNGPLEKWRGEASLRVGHAASGAVSFNVEQLEPLAFTADIAVHYATIRGQRVEIPGVRVQVRNATVNPEGELDGTVRWKDVELAVKTGFLWKDGRMTLADAVVKERGNTITGHVTFDSSLNLAEGQLRLEMLRLADAANGRAVGEFALSHADGEQFIAAHVEGEYRQPFSAALRSRIERNADHLRCVVDELDGHYGALRGHLIEPLQITRANESWALESLKLKLDSGQLEASGSYAPGAIAATANLSDLPLSVLQAAGLSNLHGTATGRLVFDGDPRQPHADLDVRLADVDLFEMTNIRLDPVTLEAQAKLRGAQLLAELRLEGLSDNPVRARLDIPAIFSLRPFMLSVPRDKPLKAELTADVDIESLTRQMAVEDQVMKGRLEASLTVGGTIAAPSANGRVAISGGSYEHLVYGTVLRRVEIEITVDASRLVIRRADATDGNRGTWAMSGFVNLAPADGYPLSIELQAKNAAVIRHDNGSANVDGTLSLTGALKEMTLRGDLTLTQAEFIIPNRLPVRVPVIEVIEINKPGQPGPEPVAKRAARPGRILADVRVHLPRRGFVRGRGLESEWSGDLRLAGLLTAPLLSGRFTVVRGYVLFLGRRFTLGRSTLLLDGSVPPSPRLDVNAQARAADIIARLNVTGPVAAPVLALDSNPELPQDEIMARLLFGRSSDRITPFQAVSLANGLNVLRGGGTAMDILGRGQSLLRVDQISVQQDEETSGVASVTVGKYIGNSVYVQGQKGMTAQGDALLVELELNPSLTLQTEASPQIREGIRLIWSRDY